MVLKNKRVFKGAIALQTNKMQVVFGAPSGLVQHLLKSDQYVDKRELLVDTVFLSDLTVYSHTSQQDIEFLFFTAMFLGMDFSKNQPCSMLYDFSKGKILKRFRVIVPKGRENNIYDQVEYTLFGARRKFMKEECQLDNDLIDILAAEQENWYIKNDGKQVTVKDLVEVLTYDKNGEIEVDDIKVKMKGNTFTIYNQGSNEVLDSLDISFEGRIDPAWKIPVKKKAVDLSGISLIPLGTASPFNPDEPSTCYWLQIRDHGHFLIDCGFLTWQCFDANGGDLTQLRGIIITHGHGDHIDLTAYMNRSCKLEIWTTKEIFEMAKRITCAKSNIDNEEFSKHFIHVQIEASYPDKKGNIRGASMFIDDLELRFHYSIHSIPTIGVNLRKEGKKLVAFSSDMCDFDTMYKLKEKGVISEERANLIKQRLSSEGNNDCWILLDCGGDGFIHGKIEGYLPYYQEKDKIVMCHRERRSPGEKLLARLSEPLTVYKIKTGENLERGLTIVTEYLKDIGLHPKQNLQNWANTLSQNLEIVNVLPNHFIIEEGQKTTNDFYFIGSGICLIQINGKDCGKLISGDYFGEQSFLPFSQEDTWLYSILATSAVAYYRLPSEIMSALINENTALGGDIQEKLFDKMRFAIAVQLSVLASKLNLPTKFFKDLYSRAEEKYYRKGKYIFKRGDKDDGHMYIIVSGKLEIRSDKISNPIILEEYSCVGEIVASGRSEIRNADVLILEPSVLIKLSHDDFFEIMNKIPSFSSRVNDISLARINSED